MCSAQVSYLEFCFHQGVPLEYREDDFQLIKALAAVEKDIDSSQEQMVVHARFDLLLPTAVPQHVAWLCAQMRTCRGANTPFLQDSIDQTLSRQKSQNPSRVSMPSWWPVNSNQPSSMQMPSV